MIVYKVCIINDGQYESHVETPPLTYEIGVITTPKNLNNWIFCFSSKEAAQNYCKYDRSFVILKCEAPNNSKFLPVMNLQNYKDDIFWEHVHNNTINNKEFDLGSTPHDTIVCPWVKPLERI
jgi:hypothetical protein